MWVWNLDRGEIGRLKPVRYVSDCHQDPSNQVCPRKKPLPSACRRRPRRDRQQPDRQVLEGRHLRSGLGQERLGPRRVPFDSCHRDRRPRPAYRSRRRAPCPRGRPPPRRGRRRGRPPRASAAFALSRCAPLRVLGGTASPAGAGQLGRPGAGTRSTPWRPLRPCSAARRRRTGRWPARRRSRSADSADRVRART